MAQVRDTQPRSPCPFLYLQLGLCHFIFMFSFGHCKGNVANCDFLFFHGEGEIWMCSFYGFFFFPLNKHALKMFDICN